MRKSLLVVIAVLCMVSIAWGGSPKRISALDLVNAEKPGHTQMLIRLADQYGVELPAALQKAKDMLPEETRSGRLFRSRPNSQLRKMLLDDQVTAIIELWNGSDWELFERTTENIGPYGPTEMLFELYNAGVWELSTKEVYTYDGSGNLTQVMLQAWDGSGWLDFMRMVFTYDGSGYLVEVKIQMNIGTGWMDLSRTQFTNDASGNTLEEIDQTWDGTQWVNDIKIIYTWSGGRIVEDYWYEWDGSQWVNWWKDTYTYDGSGNLTEYLELLWNGSAYEQTWRTTYSYDGSGNMTQYLLEWWDGAGWIPDSKAMFSYDGSGRPAQDLFQYHDGTQWVNDMRITYSYGTGVEDEPGFLPEEFALGNYPNPFNPETMIQFRLPGASDVTLKIYNLKGSLIRTLISGEAYAPGTHEIRWNGTDSQNRPVPSGIYLYRMKAGAYNETRRCLLMK